jgi:molybdopterin molybdotransferase
MEITLQLTKAPVAETIPPPEAGGVGAWAEFRGIVRAAENDTAISALEYEVYPEMAEREIRRLLEEISARHPCLAVRVIHRIGIVPVGETAVYVGVAAKHRGSAFELLVEFMARLKQDVPIWKRRALPVVQSEPRSDGQNPTGVRPHRQSAADNRSSLCSLQESIAEVQARCQPLPPVRVALEVSLGRVLREPVCAAEDMPACDRSTRDGYAILMTDRSDRFQIVDTLHAADWKPRQLKVGEAVRVATGTALPCADLRVVMQEHVERKDETIKISRLEPGANVRRSGGEAKAGQPLLTGGVRLDAGKLALLASVGCTQPLVSPRPRVAHFTTGDEIIPPGQKPERGQIRDSNSILIRSLLQPWQCEVFQKHLPEDFAAAKVAVNQWQAEIEHADMVLISGGASVGEKDFTRPFLEWLNFETVFSQVNVRPGKPLIFGVSKGRVAFGLPGNPLSHFVCFHFAVAAALATLTGEKAPSFRRGQLAVPLDDAACPRETLWPARLDLAGLHPLPWASSGDVTCLAEANALVRVPPNCHSMTAGAAVDFLAPNL